MEFTKEQLEAIAKQVAELMKQENNASQVKSLPEVESNLGKFVIIRTDTAGVHMGQLVKKEVSGGHYAVVLKDSRRIWSWAGANSLSELAHSGSKKPEGCNISLPVTFNEMMAIEIITCSQEGEKALQAIKDWKFTA